MSRPERWAKAVEALQQLDAGEFEALREEYQEWLDGMPEGLDASPTAEKLEAAIDAAEQVVDAVEELTAAIENAETIELPLGFGRD